MKKDYISIFFENTSQMFSLLLFLTIMVKFVFIHNNNDAIFIVISKKEFYITCLISIFHGLYMMKKAKKH